jgi:hypothetical protein
VSKKEGEVLIRDFKWLTGPASPVTWKELLKIVYTRTGGKENGNMIR